MAATTELFRQRPEGMRYSKEKVKTKEPTWQHITRTTGHRTKAIINMV